MTNFGIDRQTIITFLYRLAVLLTAVPVHECAHAFAADRLGDDTPRNQGRLTLNPFKHLEWSGSLLMFFVGFGWGKPVMVDSRNFKHPRRDNAITALVGPASNLVIAVLVIVFFKLLIIFLPYRTLVVHIGTISEILQAIIVINISLAVFNFLPVPPLDGSKIIGVLLPEKLYWGMLRYQRQISMVFMILVILGVLSPLVQWMAWHTFYGIDRLTAPLGRLFE